ncbi:hypothetical protein [Gulosibacter sp. 10]|uniref:hypothetical protein n=1 Tax=Gulosibacter sp. 10 TaxID=1255570 RepID=UPI00097EBB73|nr:hypothetical protein [Gulosibacter sp. 10]SJM67238.1 Substrate-specific component STY3230 of queuosine-regulated ECF transporter [Gulosibacter sp. 10]
MEGFDTASEATREPLDRFALDLQRLRELRGVSYTDLAARVSELRTARGLHEAAARTPRSTVYNCFRTGRARIDTGLLRDIALALTRDEAEAEGWVARYLEAREQSEALRRTAANAAPAGAPAEPGPAPAASDQPRPARLSWRVVVLTILAGVLINRLGMELNTHFGFSLFLDMIGTCIAAIVLGPWHGVAVAVLYQGIALLGHFDAGALFGLVNITGALVWGYGVRRFKMGGDFSRFALLGLAAAIACSAVGVPINMLLSAGGAWSGLDASVQSLESMGVSFTAAILSANITASIIDKLLAGFIALVVFVLLHRRYGFPAAHMPLVEHLGILRVPGMPSSHRPKTFRPAS